MSTDPEWSDQCKRESDMLDQHVNQLSEHWDTVHIFVCRHLGESDKTRYLDRAGGNFFTRFGQIDEWMIRQRERIRQEVREESK